MQNGNNVGITFLLMAVCGVLAGIQLAFTRIPFGITINIAISVVIILFFCKK